LRIRLSNFYDHLPAYSPLSQSFKQFSYWDLGLVTPLINSQNMNEISATEKTAISMVLKVLLAPNIIFICTIMIPVKI